ncbi:MaoC/PaaZ C-terminal domain-containing protein [Micromonospora inyonensis]|uniref:Acyl dehydratase n=1 Tax=Micromonospora inyonensis TaxID=47866 RepID=A0A1C6RNL4_9ACTN|nr:MaoC/PaaZ C-terminal domain-containing protein [Micromonospora inyonensis]SCL18767.1 Acyl dehydratase [Micromonospora inyonensis]
MSAETVRSGTGASAELFFEDLTPGRWFDLGVITVDGDEMVAFARRFDPQWYHVDEELAGQSHHGGLIASGFFTVSLFMRAYVDHVLSRAAADASPGLEELRWLAPARAGDRLAVRLDVVGSKPSTARPGLGTVTLTGTMLRLDPDGRPECEVLRTRFRGWFTLRVQPEPVDATEPDGAVDGDDPLPDRPDPAATGAGADPSTEATPDALPGPAPAFAAHPTVTPTGPASPTGPTAPPVNSLDAPTAVLPGPVVSAPPAPAPAGPAGRYGPDTPTAVIPAAREPHGPPEPSYRLHPAEAT